MTPSLIFALLALGFIAGSLWTWDIAYKRGKNWRERNGTFEQFDEDNEEWWQL